MEKIVYQMGWIALTVGGAAASIFRVLPIENTTVFLLGLFWVWNGVFALLGIPYPMTKAACMAERRIWGASGLAMGAVWIGMSLTPLADQLWPMAAASVPFLLADILAGAYFKRKK